MIDESATTVRLKPDTTKTRQRAPAASARRLGPQRGPQARQPRVRPECDSRVGVAAGEKRDEAVPLSATM